jgi:Predicted transcriptional regulators
MPIDDLTALGQKMREARKNKELTQQELSDLSHVSVKQIANIEKGKMNPSYLILRALAKGPAHLFRYTYKSRCFSGG